jgi:hypothetical protein
LQIPFATCPPGRNLAHYRRRALQSPEVHAAMDGIAVDVPPRRNTDDAATALTIFRVADRLVDATSRKVDMIAAWSVDRFGRSPGAHGQSRS